MEANSFNYYEFNFEYSLILEGNDFLYLVYVDVPALPLGETKRLDVLRKGEISLTHRADKSLSLEVIISGYHKGYFGKVPTRIGESIPHFEVIHKGEINLAFLYIAGIYRVI